VVAAAGVAEVGVAARWRAAGLEAVGLEAVVAAGQEVGAAAEFAGWLDRAAVEVVRWVGRRPGETAIESVRSAVPADQGVEAAWSAVRGGLVRRDGPVVSDPAAASSPA
jgi:hypothetical protein